MTEFISKMEPKNPNFMFTFVRMNPPTPGHLSLIEDMLEQAVSNNVKNIYVFTSKKIDIKNPLACDKNYEISSKIINTQVFTPFNISNADYL